MVKKGLKVLVDVTGIVMDNGQQCLVQFTDITTRKQVEAALQESEEKFKAVFESAKDGIFLLSNEGSISALNEAFARMHGYTVDEMVKMNLQDLNTPETSRLSPARFQKIMTGESMSFEVEHFCKNGHTLPFEVTANVVTIAGIKYILGFLRDITLRKLAEDEISQKNEELARISNEKDKFFSIIAHDLRSPFNSLLGFTRLLVEDLPTMTVAETQKIALTMRKSATNLFGLLENLLEWSRMQRGLIKFYPEPRLLLPKVLTETALLMESVNKKEITLNYNITEDIEVYADENMLGSILRNLVNNAVKFTPEGGKVTISAKLLDNAVECSVKDTGIGMNQEMQENLFNITFNASRKGTEKEPSTGLGLILCKEFVEKHGGKLWVESEESQGSTFYFDLPFNPVKKPLVVRPEIALAAGRIERPEILIVEDDEISDSLISIIVEKYSKEIFHAKTGVEAVKVCQQNPDIDLVFMDINLPEMDGLEATCQIRQFNKDIVIIAQTAFRQSGDKEKAMEAGCNDYITKPIESKLLQRVIQKYFPM